MYFSPLFHLQEAVDNYMAVPECREEVRLACPLCEEQFPKMSLFQMHMSWKHKGKEWDKEGLCSAILRVSREHLRSSE